MVSQKNDERKPDEGETPDLSVSVLDRSLWSRLKRRLRGHIETRKYIERRREEMAPAAPVKPVALSHDLSPRFNTRSAVAPSHAEPIPYQSSYSSAAPSIEPSFSGGGGSYGGAGASGSWDSGSSDSGSSCDSGSSGGSSE